MKKIIVIAVIVAVCFSILEAEDKEVLVIGHTMYQKQKIDYKTVVTFAADKEGKRVWNWSHAQRYCKNLRLNNYSDWQVASKAELLKIMTKDQGYNGLYVKNSFARYMPEPDPKYFDVWMWTRDSKSSNLGAFVNFKKGKTGWADKKYKGYVICTRNVGKKVKQGTGIVKLKRPIVFEYQKKVWRSDMTQKGTISLENYSLLNFYCQNGLEASIPSASRLIKHKKLTYFFAYKSKDKKRLNLYRTNGSIKGTKKIGSIGKEVAYSPIWVGDKLYFLSSAYLPQQADPMKEKLWVLDTRTNSMRYVGKTASEKKGNMYPFAKSNTKLFFKYISYDDNRKQEYQEIWTTDPKKGLKKVKRFQKIPDNFKNIKVAGKNHKLKPLDLLPWGCGRDSSQGSFKIVNKFLLYKNRQILNLSSVKDLKVHDVKIVFNGRQYSVFASNRKLWGVDGSGNIKKLKNEKK